MKLAKVIMAGDGIIFIFMTLCEILPLNFSISKAFSILSSTYLALHALFLHMVLDIPFVECRRIYVLYGHI